MVAFSSLTLTLLGFWVTTARRKGYGLQFPFFSIPIIFVSSVLQVMVGLSGFGLIFPYSPALFVFGMLSIMLFAGNMFLAMLHITWKE